MNYKLEEKNGELYVTASVGPSLKNQPPSSITTQNVLQWLYQSYPTYIIEETIRGGIAHNAASAPQRTNVWIFSYKTQVAAPIPRGLQEQADAIKEPPAPSPPNTIKKYRKIRKMRPKQN